MPAIIPGELTMRDKNGKTFPPSFTVVSGWKGIAAYLGKGVRTVQRYERELGLPIHRPGGKITGSVITTKAELDAWVAASPLRDAFDLTQVNRDVERNSRQVLSELRALVSQARRLRSETAELRQSVWASFEMLQSRLQAAMMKRDPTPSNHGSILSDPERRLLADVLPFDRTKKKVG